MTIKPESFAAKLLKLRTPDIELSNMNCVFVEFFTDLFVNTDFKAPLNLKELILILVVVLIDSFSIKLRSIL